MRVRRLAPWLVRPRRLLSSIGGARTDNMTDSFDYRKTAPAPSVDRPLRRGVVGVIVRDYKLLVIRRSQFVRAPGLLCLPGGGIEPGESEQAALVRELREELGVDAELQGRLWECTTAWNVHLAWYQATFPRGQRVRPNEHEVAEVLWLSLAELECRTDALGSVAPFVKACRAGEICFDSPA